MGRQLETPAPVMTDGQREQVRPYERHLETAVKGDFVLGASQEARRVLFDVYNDLFRAAETNRQCGHCVLRVCKRLGALYFAKVAENATREPNSTPTDQLTTPAKKTPTRGKKTGSE